MFQLNYVSIVSIVCGLISTMFSKVTSSFSREELHKQHLETAVIAAAWPVDPFLFQLPLPFFLTATRGLLAELLPLAHPGPFRSLLHFLECSDSLSLSSSLSSSEGLSLSVTVSFTFALDSVFSQGHLSLQWCIFFLLGLFSPSPYLFSHAVNILISSISVFCNNAKWNIPPPSLSLYYFPPNY